MKEEVGTIEDLVRLTLRMMPAASENDIFKFCQVHVVSQGMSEVELKDRIRSAITEQDGKGAA